MEFPKRFEMMTQNMLKNNRMWSNMPYVVPLVRVCPGIRDRIVCCMYYSNCHCMSNRMIADDPPKTSVRWLRVDVRVFVGLLGFSGFFP